MKVPLRTLSIAAHAEDAPALHDAEEGGASLSVVDLFRAQFRKSCAMLRKRGRRRDEAEDLVQEAFVRLLAYLDHGSRIVQPEAFIARAAINLSVDRSRRERAHLFALGTSFLIRRDMARTAVTLLEGKVEVTSHDVIERAGSRSWPAVTLTPGERLVFAQGTSAVLDRPNLDSLTAWRHGLVNISDLTLAQAVEEMNRYNTLQIIVTGAATELRVSGVFRTSDSESFVRAVAVTHGLHLRREGLRIVISGELSRPSESRFDASRSPVGNVSPL